MNKQKTNGVASFDAQMEQQRMQVVQLELRARYWKAQYEIKQYMLNDKELKEPYEAYMAEIIEEEKNKLEELKKQMEINEQHGVTVEPVMEEATNETEEQPE